MVLIEEVPQTLIAFSKLHAILWHRKFRNFLLLFHQEIARHYLQFLVYFNSDCLDYYSFADWPTQNGVLFFFAVRTHVVYCEPQQQIHQINIYFVYAARL